jgi:hypothetical protein
MKNAHNVACPQNGKTFISKIRMAQKGTCTQIILQIWAVLGRFGPFWAVLCPENGHSCFPEKWFAHFGTCLCPHWRRLHPLKTANHLFWKQECPKKGHAVADPGAGCTLENGKSFILETRMPQKGTCINDNPMITLR